MSHRSDVLAMRRLAQDAVAQYPLPSAAPGGEGRLTFVTMGENATFRHDSRAGSFLVRLHRPHRHGQGVDSRAAIASELDWLAALRADTTLLVPEALATDDGRTIVSASAGGRTRLCTVLRWMPGRIHEESARPVHFARLGAAMAALHAHADTWEPPPGFTRIVWDHEAFFGNAMIYGEVPAAECWRLLPAALRIRFEAVADRLRALMASADGGLIHADLHFGNVLFERGRLKLIDFDDCGTGPRLYDLAVALWEYRDRPGYDERRAALLGAYAAVRDIDTAELDAFIALRQVAFDLWCTGTAQTNERFAARLDAVHDWSSDMLDLVAPARRPL